MNLMNLSSLKRGPRPAVTGNAAVTRGKKYRAVVSSKGFKKGDIVEVTYAGVDKITFMAPRAQYSMLPADFLNAFTEVAD